MQEYYGDIADAVGGVLYWPTASFIKLILNALNGMLALLLRDDASDLEKVDTGKFISPEEIFKGDIPILNGDIFEYDANAGGTANDIKKTAAQIYVLVRNISALIMLAGLIFTGIKIIMTSNIPTKKMQYLMLLEDWIIGMILLIFSHIIMIFVFELSGILVDVFKAGIPSGSGLMQNISTNINNNVSFIRQVTNLILFGYLTWMVIVFTVSYFKRFFWIVVLTIFAPVVSIMYAFGQQTKSIYSRWLKEYIMTALIQPFHMLVYNVLIMIPIGVIDNSTSLPSMIYALVAISFIRPAEKYLRELFGMDKGIANMGSYDSGVAPIKAVGKAVGTVASFVADAYAPGSGAMIRGAMKAGESVEEGSGENDTSLEQNQEDVANEEENSLAQQAATRQSLAAGPAAFMRDLRKDSPMLSEGMTDEEIAETFFDDGRGVRGLLEDGGFSNDTIDAYLGTGIYSNENANGAAEENALAQERATESVAENSSGNGSLNASNITINASTVDVNGQSTATASRLAEIASSDPLKKDDEGPLTADTQTGLEDGNVELGKQSRFKRILSAVGRGGEVAGGLMFNPLGTLTGFAGQAMSGSQKPLIRKIGAHGMAIGSFAKRFKENGGLAALYGGLEGIRDTMYVGGAPGDWQSTVQGAENRRKKKQEKQKYNFTHSAQNMEFMLTGEGGPKLLEKIKLEYPDKPLERQITLAKELAQKKLEALASAYVPYGITDVGSAYVASEYAKKNNVSARQSIIGASAQGAQTISFEKFNIDKRNLSAIRAAYPEIKVDTPVSVAIPAASEYFSRGITDVGSMIDADRIAEKLSQQFGTQLSAQLTRDIATQVIRNGGVQYNGSNEEIRRVIEELTKKGKKK